MNRRRVWLAVVLILAACVRLALLNRPFGYDAEGSGSLNGVLARSYLRFNWSDTHGMPVLSLDRDRGSPIVFYPDHPPLVPLLIVPFYRLFGVGEWQTRLPIAITTVGAILLLYQLVAASASPRAGVVAAALFAATPMTLYFGGFADVVGMPLIFCALVAVSVYVRFQRAPGLRTFVPCIAGFALAGLCDWPAYVLAPIFAAHYAATRPRREWPWMLAFGLAACAVFAAVYIYITVATHQTWTWMADLFARRSALVGGHAYTAQRWLSIAAQVNIRYHTLPLMAAAGGWIVSLASRLKRLPTPFQSTSVAGVLLAWAVVYAVIGAKALYDHEWAWILFTPGLAVAAALLLARLPDAPLAAVCLGFAAWTVSGAFTAFSPAHRDRPFTPLQMATAIRIAAPDPRDVALIVGNDADAQAWFYGDRPLRTGIWSIDDFERRLDDDTVDLMFNFDEQPWKARATGLVFPKMWAGRFGTLHAYLRTRYLQVPLPAPLAGAFDVFDVRERPPS